MKRWKLSCVRFDTLVIIDRLLVRLMLSSIDCLPVTAHARKACLVKVRTGVFQMLVPTAMVNKTGYSTIEIRSRSHRSSIDA